MAKDPQVVCFKTARCTTVVPMGGCFDVKTEEEEVGIAIALGGELEDDSECEVYWVISDTDAESFAKQLLDTVKAIKHGEGLHPCRLN